MAGYWWLRIKIPEMIPRDGACKSLWQTDARSYSPVNRLNRRKIYDVAIVGGGITGVSTALLLQQAGKSCILMESNTLCFGSTGGTTAHLSNLPDTPYSTLSARFGKEAARLVRQSAEQAIGLIRRNIRKYDIHCGFENADAVIFSQNPSQDNQLEAWKAGCLEAGLDSGWVDQSPVPMDFTRALLVKGQGKFHPVKYVQGIARAFEKIGGTIVQRCRVQEFRMGDPLRIETSHGFLESRYLVFATHIPPGCSGYEPPCAAYRSYAVALRIPEDRYFPELVYDMEDPYHYYRCQWVKGKRYLIAGGADHRTGQVEDTRDCFRMLEDHIRQLFPVKEITHRWSSQYFKPEDGLPYIGALQGKEGKVFVATGYGGDGMVYSGVASLLIRKLIRKEKTALTGLFSPNRFQSRKVFSNRAGENGGPSRGVQEIQHPEELAPGEGRVGLYDKRSLAQFRDQKGNLIMMDSACRHQQCQITWNPAEKSWDCPCHGSRYSTTGKLLNGPADQDLILLDLHPALPQSR